jgi:hypothetical protein
MSIFIVRLNTTFRKLYIQMLPTTCFGHNQVDFTTYMEKDIQVNASPSQFTHSKEKSLSCEVN